MKRLGLIALAIVPALALAVENMPTAGVGAKFPSFKLRDYRGAESQYREAFRGSPYHPYLSYDLGLLLQRQNRLKEAQSSYLAAQRQLETKITQERAAAAQYAQILSPAGNLTDPGLRGRYQQELETTNQLITALTENEAEVLNAMGTVLEQRGDRPAAAAQYKLAYGLNEKLLIARHKLHGAHIVQPVSKFY